jgi:hypothetical protein
MTTGAKTDFSAVYTQPDPRAYYESLRSLDYEIPAHGRDVFAAVLQELDIDQSDATVLDVCSSYGVNAALLNHSVTLEEVEEHYAAADGLSRTELIARDRDWFGGRRHENAVDIVGVDISEPAISYATEAGLLTDGIVADLENEELSESDAAKIADVDLVTVTGGIGYVNGRTFEQILGATDEPPWVAALSLRWVDFDPIAEVLDQQGLSTERVEGYLAPQRRFSDTSEERFVLDQLASQGIEPTAFEHGGYHCAELYVARPPDAVDRVPLQGLLSQII